MNRQRTLTEGPIGRTLFVFALPILGGNVLRRRRMRGRDARRTGWPRWRCRGDVLARGGWRVSPCAGGRD